MPLCPRCSAEAPAGSRFCPTCGAGVEASASAPTRTSLHSGPTARGSLDRGESAARSYPTLDDARFLPGTTLAGRYRIIGLLGRGGMGEVYRADDLKLGQPVALKFLPARVERDEDRLRRFLNEVKLARQVSHSNVCRVFDVGEADGQHYLSMEYVDGEDLSSLLRRIGRLPRERAVQVARQLCAGLAAAHEQGILHRDLKPANVMIDGRGRVKITDFGLAGLAESFGGDELRAGTPAYMAPEQFAGREVSVKSDLYALGLVLYELFTGKAAFEAGTPAELARLHRESSPTNPSSHVEGLDATVERVILRCLEKEPGDRPASALAVAAALPGGDPLAAALAAGETPSPEMIADAGTVGGLRPPVAVACLALVLLGLAAVPYVSGRCFLAPRVALELPPEALSVRAGEIVEEAGYVEPPTDTAHGFAYDDEYLQHVRERPAAERWRDLATVRPAPIYYWYRQSPRYMTPNYLITGGGISPDDPAPVISGMVGVRLDPRGRLLRLEAVPPQRDESESEGPGPEPDWAALFGRAGIDLASFTATRPTWNPLGDCDVRRAWEGAYPARPETPIRIEAGSWRGRPVLFQIITPWTQARRMEPVPWGPGEKAIAIFGITVLFGVLLGGALLARRNVRLGRGDRRGAFRVASVVFAAGLASWLLAADHQPTFAEIGLLFQQVAWGLLFAGGLWLVYVALEPYARRLWPSGIISWNRVLQGRFRDPLVGRDILVGGLASVAATALVFLAYALPDWTGLPATRPYPGPLDGLAGLRQSVGFSFGLIIAGLTDTVLSLFLLLLLRVILRKPWLAAGALALLFTVPSAASATNPAVEGPIWLLINALWIFVLVRFGMLAYLAGSVFWNTFAIHVYTTDVSAWFAGRSILGLLLLAAVAGWGFWLALAGRPLLSEKLLDAEAGAKP